MTEAHIFALRSYYSTTKTGTLFREFISDTANTEFQSIGKIFKLTAVPRLDVRSCAFAS